MQLEILDGLMQLIAHSHELVLSQKREREDHTRTIYLNNCPATVPLHKGEREIERKTLKDVRQGKGCNFRLLLVGKISHGLRCEEAHHCQSIPRAHGRKHASCQACLHRTLWSLISDSLV